MRSPTAADVARECWGIETDFAGLSADAGETLSSEQIARAEVVLVMDRRKRARRGATARPHHVRCTS